MALFDVYQTQAPIAVAGMVADGNFDRSVSSYEAAADLTPGVFCSLTASSALGKATPGVAGAGGKLGVVLNDDTKKLPFPTGSMVPVIRKGRVWAVLAGGATAPAHQTAVQVNATGQVVSAAGTAVLGAFGYNYGTSAGSAIAGLCLIELNLPA